MRRVAAILLSALALCLWPAAALATAPLANLRVEGEPGWRTTSGFWLDWEGSFADAIGYRFVGVPWATETALVTLRATSIYLSIPAPPGSAEPPPGGYEVSLWRQGPDGTPGPPSSVTLLFDHAVPAAPLASGPAGWVDGRGPIRVSISAPTAPAPASGLQGYATSLSARPGESPCFDPRRCTAAEVDLPGGGAHQIDLGPQPQGVGYLNVAAVSGSGIASPPLSVPIQVDASAPTVGLAGVPAGWIDHPVAISAIAEDSLSGTAAAGPSGPFTAIAVDDRVPTVVPGGVASTMVSGQGSHRVSGWGRDTLGNAGGPATASAATVRIDETPPAVAFASSQRPEDPELIAVAVADRLSGPSADRGAIGVRPAGSSERFLPLPTQATGAGLLARWSSDDYRAGSYEFRATGFDAAGNSATTSTRADGTPMVLRNPLKLPTAIGSGFGGARLVWQHCRRVDGGRRCHREAVTDFDSRPALWTVPYGRPLRFGGILRSAAGAPLAGLPVEIVETFAPGARAAQRRTTVTSDGRGRFEARLAPGPSRRVEAFFAGTRTLTRTTGRSVTMAVRTGVRFHASSESARIGGKPVVFSGRLLADEATIPRTGRPVQLEFRVPGGAWSEFRTVQTDRHGRFRFPYAFTDDDSRGIRFQFRAASPEQPDWPYRPAASRPAAVTGY